MRRRKDEREDDRQRWEVIEWVGDRVREGMNRTEARTTIR